jgi:hypothetical protein
VSDLGRRLAAQLPDQPRWLETRGMLLGGRAQITGGTSVETGFVARLVDGAVSVVAVVGRASPAAIARASDNLTAMTPILVQTDNAEHVASALAAAPGDPWQPERAILHRLSVQPSPPPFSDSDVRLLSAGDVLDHLPPGLRYEITHASRLVPIAVVVQDGRPVSFCYACWMTETLWDVSIDTLESGRSRGLGATAVTFMIDVMRQGGREPVWGALESNASSLRLASKLGFRPVDEVVCFSRGSWAFFTAGYQS